MKKIISCVIAGSMISAMAVFPAGAAEAPADLVYGTMQIPYAEFYAAEGEFSQVDAVSSATQQKWQNQELVGGTYYEAHTEDEGGTILGVVYPVAVSAADLEALGDDNYGFTELAEAPAAYKMVEVTDDGVQFSAVQAETNTIEAEVSFQAESAYGDYEMEVKSINNKGGTSDIGTIAGVIVSTDDGAVYAMRHLENIWQDKLSWSCGITTTEKHGNVLQSAQYEDMMGKTICGITYITDSGYYSLDTGSIYVPVKFAGSVTVAEAAADALTTAVTLEGFPEDYDAAYTVEGIEVNVEDGALSWEQAYAGSYTLTVSDAAGVYADYSSSFVLTTEDVPAAFDSESAAIVALEGVSEEAFAAYMSNVQSVTVNGEEYRTMGKNSAAIIGADGTIDPAASMTMGRGEDAETVQIFPESGDYEIVVSATGYVTPLSFTYTVE